jgi:hypothetical protein
MALNDSRGKREYDKFLADSSGDTALRVTATSSVLVTADTSSGAITVAGATHVTADSAEKVLMAATDVSGKARIGLQVWNLGAASSTHRDLKVRVWGTLKAAADYGSVPGVGWTQIGDDIDLNAASGSDASAYRAIATTPIKYVAVTAYLDGAGGGPLDTTADCYIMAD